MQPTIQIPQLPQLKADGTFDTQAVQKFLEDIQKTLQSKQLSDYNNSADLAANLETKITAVGDGITESGGSGANRYIKFRDGTLIQWCNIVVAHTTLFDNNIGTYGWSYYAGSITMSFPIAFADTYYDVVGTSNIHGGMVTIRRTNASSYGVNVYSFISGTSAASVIATGRWK